MSRTHAERLRAIAYEGVGPKQFFADCADAMDTQEREITALRAENARLREALRKIAERGLEGDRAGSFEDALISEINAICDFANAALGEGEG